MVMQGGNVSNAILQVLSAKKIVSPTLNQNRYRLLLSDGKHSINSAFFSFSINESHLEAAAEINSIIKVNQLISNVINVPGKGDT